MPEIPADLLSRPVVFLLLSNIFDSEERIAARLRQPDPEVQEALYVLEDFLAEHFGHHPTGNKLMWRNAFLMSGTLNWVKIEPASRLHRWLVLSDIQNAGLNQYSTPMEVAAYERAERWVMDPRWPVLTASENQPLILRSIANPASYQNAKHVPSAWMRHIWHLFLMRIRNFLPDPATVSPL